MQAFFLRLVPPRPTFAADMSDAEHETMVAHVAYWSGLLDDGKVLAFGPVEDPVGVHGIGIVLAADLAEAEAMCDADPAMQSPHGFRTEISPMLRLVTPQGMYSNEG